MWFFTIPQYKIPNLPIFTPDCHGANYAMVQSHGFSGMVVSPALKNRLYYGQTVTAPLMLGPDAGAYHVVKPF